LPSNQTPLGALPARFRKERLLIVGCGDIGLRLARLARPNVRLIALTSNPNRTFELKSQGITTITGDLDHARTLSRLSGLCTRLVHLAPPPGQGAEDWRTRNLIHTLLKRSPPVHCVYASTSGVYGDCSGDWVSETRALNPITERAKRRVHAEALMRFFVNLLIGSPTSPRLTTLRVPGIYALNREQGTPEGRLKRGTPVLDAKSDVYTNHIQADDLARACWLALWRGPNNRAINTSDDSHMKMAEYMDWAADRFGVARPPRISLEAALEVMNPMQLSFMQESRRLVNIRLKNELKLKLLYPTIKEGLSVPKDS